jgi:hypothetical protein
MKRRRWPFGDSSSDDEQVKKKANGMTALLSSSAPVCEAKDLDKGPTKKKRLLDRMFSESDDEVDTVQSDIPVPVSQSAQPRPRPPEYFPLLRSTIGACHNSRGIAIT